MILSAVSRALSRRVLSLSSYTEAVRSPLAVRLPTLTTNCAPATPPGPRESSRQSVTVLAVPGPLIDWASRVSGRPRLILMAPIGSAPVFSFRAVKAT